MVVLWQSHKLEWLEEPSLCSSQENRFARTWLFLDVTRRLEYWKKYLSYRCLVMPRATKRHLSNWQMKTLSEAAWSAASSKCCWNEWGWQSGWWGGRRGLAIVLNPLGKKYTNARHMNLSWVGKEILKRADAAVEVRWTYLTLLRLLRHFYIFF